MPRKSASKVMIEFVWEYLDGETERLFFDLNFNYYLNEHYQKMEHEDPDFAECFLFYVTE